MTVQIKTATLGSREYWVFLRDGREPVRVEAVLRSIYRRVIWSEMRSTKPSPVAAKAIHAALST